MKYIPESGKEYPKDQLDREFTRISQTIDELHPSGQWRDILGQITTRGVGSTDPSWTQIGSGPFYGYVFAINDVACVPFHIPHDFSRNSDVYFHTHWISDGTQANSVKWEYYYSYAKGFNQEAFDPVGTQVFSEEAASGTAYQHMVTESDAVSIAGLDEPDGIIYIRLKRVTNGGTDNTDNIFVLLTDLHYQTTNSATPGKAPDFYRSA